MLALVVLIFFVFYFLGENKGGVMNGAPLHGAMACLV